MLYCAPSPESTLPDLDLDKISAFIARWKGNSAGEMATAQSHFIDLCEALDVPRPSPQDAAEGSYRFEKGVAVVGPRGSAPSVERIDVYRKDHFIWENKQGSEVGDAHKGTARRGTNTWRVAMRAAFGQAKRYARHIDGRPPPFLVVCDVGHYFEIWANFSGQASEFDELLSRRIPFEDLSKPENADYLRKVMSAPQTLNPALVQTRVTREIAKELADLAKELERTGEPAGVVARFLMRCVFTMFAEDTELLPPKSFSGLLKGFLTNPMGLLSHLEHLWQLMDMGGFSLGLGRIARFNGGLFAGSCSVPLSPAAVTALSRAAERDWSQVEPTIFGTLVEQALGDRERHSLGAHFTPRPYIERVVRATVMEPLRDDWLTVRGEVQTLIGEGEPTEAARKKAIGVLQAFHAKLCQVRVLDPACGTGNFLYVTYDLLKDLEAEVLRAMADLGQKQEGLAGLQGATVSPAQLFGIERNSRAREIADLVLWIGHLQRTRKDRGSAAIGEPVLRELKNIEGRDAVLKWDGDPVPRLDKDGKVLTVWDMGSKLKVDAITGREVPDETLRVTLFDYPGARAAKWPEADFIVSNPPFIGNKRMRMALGDGYAEALRAAWPAVPAGVDLVMYWWERAATLTKAGKLRRFGLITTNSITQATNRAVIAPHLESGLSIFYAIADHPWVSDGAAVRIAMSVVGRSGEGAIRLGKVAREIENLEQEVPDVEVVDRTVDRIHPDLSGGADLSSCVMLKANDGLACPGVQLCGQGFLLQQVDIDKWPASEQRIVRPYLIGRALMRGGDVPMVIDTFGLDEETLRSGYPSAYSHLYDHVRPKRLISKLPALAQHWWEHERPRPLLRELLKGLPRYIATCRTAKHRVFTFLPAHALPETTIVVIASDSAAVLGTLQSRIHCLFSHNTGGFLGLGNDSRYQHKVTFYPFPMPDFDPHSSLAGRIGSTAEHLDGHRNKIAATNKKATITAQYNALTRAREAAAGGAPLTPAERTFHEAAQIGVLRSLHDDLDAAVAEAYGWPADLDDEEILTRLVALNRERAAEEATGLIRWLRPDFQAPAQGALVTTETDGEDEEAATPGGAVLPPFPGEPGPRLLALRDILRATDHPLTLAELRGRFADAKAKEVRDALDTITALGVAVVVGEGWALA